MTILVPIIILILIISGIVVFYHSKPQPPAPQPPPPQPTPQPPRRRRPPILHPPDGYLFNGNNYYNIEGVPETASDKVRISIDVKLSPSDSKQTILMLVSSVENETKTALTLSATSEGKVEYERHTVSSEKFSSVVDDETTITDREWHAITLEVDTKLKTVKVTIDGKIAQTITDTRMPNFIIGSPVRIGVLQPDEARIVNGGAVKNITYDNIDRAVTREDLPVEYRINNEYYAPTTFDRLDTSFPKISMDMKITGNDKQMFMLGAWAEEPNDRNVFKFFTAANGGMKYEYTYYSGNVKSDRVVMGNIETTATINDGQWHTIYVEVDIVHKSIKVVVDNGTPTEISNISTIQEYHIGLTAYIGGIGTVCTVKNVRLDEDYTETLQIVNLATEYITNDEFAYKPASLEGYDPSHPRISMRIKFDTPVQKQEQTIISFGKGTTEPSNRVEFDVSVSVTAMYTTTTIYTNNVKSTPAKSVIPLLGTQLFDGQWHDVTVDIYDNKSTLIVDRVQIPVFALVESKGYPTGRSVVVGYNMKGSIKNVRLGNNTIVSMLETYDKPPGEYVLNSTSPIYAPSTLEGFDVEKPSISMDIKLDQIDDDSIIAMLGEYTTENDRNVMKIYINKNGLLYYMLLVYSENIKVHSETRSLLSRRISSGEWHTIRVYTDFTVDDKIIYAQLDDYDTISTIIDDYSNYASVVGNSVQVGSDTNGMSGLVRNVKLGTTMKKLVAYISPPPVEYELDGQSYYLPASTVGMYDSPTVFMDFKMAAEVSKTLSVLMIFSATTFPSTEITLSLYTTNVLRYFRKSRAAQRSQQIKSISVNLEPAITKDEWHSITVNIKLAEKKLEVIIDGKNYEISDPEMQNYSIGKNLSIGGLNNRPIALRGLVRNLKYSKLDDVERLVRFEIPA